MVNEPCALKGWEPEGVIREQGLIRHFSASVKGAVDLFRQALAVAGEVGFTRLQARAEGQLQRRTRTPRQHLVTSEKVGQASAPARP